MSGRSAILLLTAALAISAGCRVNGPAGDQGGPVVPSREPAIAEATTREVMTKHAPDTLIARDGSSCRVGPDAYSHTAPGTRFRCPWMQQAVPAGR